MASIIHGYEYDIFISYRHNDNRSGWITEFVAALQEELAATLKEPVSVYFDTNPHNGLLETHNVDKSLEGKLKCLIFIPIISQTYCDPKSFAWQHEFIAFNKMAKEDQFGMDIRLASGNVASRVLPVKIHDLDPEDKTLLENELGVVLRSIEFIYKASGVNRSLKPKDERAENLNHTYYPDQINKVANAVKEIINSIKKFNQKDGDVYKEVFKVKPERLRDLKPKIIVAFIIILVLIALGYFFIPEFFKPSGPVEKSIAVLPFRNDSPSDSNIYFINGIMEEVLNDLQKIKDLRVISRTSVEQYRNTVKSVPEIAKELGVNYIVEGSGQKYGNTFSLRVQLITAVKENHLWSESYEQEIKEVSDICNVQRQIAQEIAKALKAIVTPQEKELIGQKPTNNTIAYDYYLKGIQYCAELKYDLAINMFSEAIEQEPGFVLALLDRSDLYSEIYFTKGNEYNYSGDWKGFDSLARADLERAHKISPDIPEVKFEEAAQLYMFERKYDKALELLSEGGTQITNNHSYNSLRSNVLRRQGKWEESLKERQKNILIDPLYAANYIELGHTSRLMRKYPEAVEFYNKSLQLDLNPENKAGIFTTILLWKGDMEEAFKVSKLDINDIKISGVNYFYYGRQYDKLLLTAGKFEDQFDYRPKSLNLAQAYFLNSNISLSRKYADSAISELTLKIKESPEDDRYYAALGYAYAYKGENKKAIENALKAVKLKPLKLDAWQGCWKEIDLAKIYILSGEYDPAMDKIEYLLTIPGDLSVPLLKIDPAYDKLRGLPRFQRILATEYKTKY